MKCTINRSRSLLSGITAAFFLFCSLYFLFYGLVFQTLLFLAIALIYVFIFFKNIPQVTITTDALTVTLFGKQIRRLKWHEVQEVGLIGEKLYSKAKKDAGHRYFYFSTCHLTLSERMELVLKWPPKDMIYAEFTEDLYLYILEVWKKPVTFFNAGKDFPDTEE